MCVRLRPTVLDGKAERRTGCVLRSGLQAWCQTNCVTKLLTAQQVSPILRPSWSKRCNLPGIHAWEYQGTSDLEERSIVWWWQWLMDTKSLRFVRNLNSIDRVTYVMSTEAQNLYLSTCWKPWKVISKFISDLEYIMITYLQLPMADSKIWRKVRFHEKVTTQIYMKCVS